MSDSDTGARIEQMVKLIQQEAEEKAKQIETDGQQKKQTEQNKIYQRERDKLYAEFAKKEEEDKTATRT